MYVDASALVKLVVEEPESTALRARLIAADLVSSVVVAVEVGRQARRADPDASQRAMEVLARVALVPLSEHVVATSVDLLPPELRSLDAIHVATCASLDDRPEALCTYDARMQEAAAARGIRILAPAS